MSKKCLLLMALVFTVSFVTTVNDLKADSGQKTIQLAQAEDIDDAAEAKEAQPKTKKAAGKAEDIDDGMVKKIAVEKPGAPPVKAAAKKAVKAPAPTAKKKEPQTVEKTAVASDEPVPEVVEVVEVEEVVEDDTQPKKTCVGRMIALYIPNRLLDIYDLLTFGVGFGPQARFQLLLTSYAEFGGFFGNMYFAEKGIERQFGGGHLFGDTKLFDSDYYQRFGAWGYHCLYQTDQNVFLDQMVGDYKKLDGYYYITDGMVNVGPEQKPYKNKLESLWGLGLELGWFINFDIKLQCDELADLVLGIFCVDIKDDDLK